ncbi:rhodanese-like domain-containing protein [Planktothricoides raciborskii]|uniref:Rhodanese-like domain-containing protein n=1 Tax=Planktothricoides raciborskii GIHE-MW2 TaxID=2792601 RepID=A0AAU8JLT4_9CYAN
MGLTKFSLNKRSPIAADFLIQSGFQSVFNITGGMVEWRQLKLAIATGKS